MCQLEILALDVIRNQPFLFGSGVLTEEAPGFPRSLAEEQLVLGCQQTAAGTQRTVEPFDGRVCEEPESQDGGGGGKRMRVEKGEGKANQNCEDRREFKIAVSRSLAAVIHLRLRGGFPLEKFWCVTVSRMSVRAIASKVTSA